MDSCGGVCGCRAPAGTGSGSTLVIGSGTGHTVRALVDLAKARGLDATVGRGVCEIRGDDLPRFVQAAVEALSVTEADEARAFYGPFRGDVSTALSAPTLAKLAARHRHRQVGDLLARPDAFFSRYQPIVDVATGTVVAHEALLRGERDGKELQPAALFAAAEAAGWTHALDRIGRETAIRGAAGWLGDDSLFINFVPTSIYRPELCLRTTERAAADAGLPLEQLVFEVVESHQVEDPSHLRRIVDHYRGQGCRVALDDVGAGYSSLTLVAALQPDVVKIDMALVQGLPDPAPTAVIRAVTEMSHGFGATVLAEGVETEEQAEAVRALGVDLGQGWLYGRPVRRTVDERVAAPVG